MSLPDSNQRSAAVSGADATDAKSSTAATLERLTETLAALEREQLAVIAERDAARAAREHAEATIALLLQWNLLLEASASDPLLLLREAPAVIVPRLADAAVLAVPELGSSPIVSTAHVNAVRARALANDPTVPNAGSVASLQRIALVSEGRALGTLTVWDERPRPISPTGSAIMSVVAHQLWVALNQMSREAPDARGVPPEALAVVCAELRSPLQALTVALELVGTRLASSADAVPTEWLQQRVDAMARAARRMDQLVDGVLVACDIHQGRLHIERQHFDLAEMVRELVAALQAELAWAGCDCEVDAPTPVAGRWDRGRVELAVLQLLTNAMKHAAGSSMSVTVRGGGRARVVVRDRGPGIPAAEAARIFEPFVRLTRARSMGGIGLGLWLAREIAEAQGGSLVVASPEGGGSEFTLELPIADGALPR